MRTRNWCITWNNPPKEKTLEIIMANCTSKYKVNYCVLGKETGKEKGTPHIQGFISFVNAIQYKSVKELFDNTAYVEEMHENSNRYACELYCKKDGNFIEYGTPPSKTIDRKTNDEEDNEIIKDILKGLTLTELCLKYAKYVKYHYRDFKQLYLDIRKDANDNQNNLDLIKLTKDLLE